MKFEIYTEEVGVYRWRLRALDGQVMAASKQSYAQSEDVHRAIIALQASIFIARIVDDAVVNRNA